MKKIVTLFMVLTMGVSLSACESKAEKDLRKATEAANRAKEAYTESVKQYEKTKRVISDYQKTVKELEKVK